MMARRLGVMGACAFAVSVILACGSDSTQEPTDAGSDTRAAKDASADRAEAASTCKLKKPYTTKDQDCNDCAEANCCEAINACLDSKECDDGYVNCILACALDKTDAGPDAGDPQAACRAQCVKDYPVGRTLYDALAACADSACASPCK